MLWTKDLYFRDTRKNKKCRRDPGKINNLKTQWLFISSFTICALDTPGTLFSYIGRNEQWALFDSLSNLPMDLECCWYHTTKNQSGQSENERKSHVFIILPLYWYSWLGFNLLFTHTLTLAHTRFFSLNFRFTCETVNPIENTATDRARIIKSPKNCIQLFTIVPHIYK